MGVVCRANSQSHKEVPNATVAPADLRNVRVNGLDASPDTQAKAVSEALRLGEPDFRQPVEGVSCQPIAHVPDELAQRCHFNTRDAYLLSGSPSRDQEDKAG